MQRLTPSFKLGLKLRFPLGTLRPLVPEDVGPEYVNGLNDPEVNRFLVNVRSACQTLASVTEYVEQNLLAPDAVLFGIWIEGDAHHCGTVRLHGADRQDGCAHVGICIFDRQRWGMGVGASAIRAVSDWACASVGVRAIEAGVYAHNVASQKAFIAAGYTWREDIVDVFRLDGRPATVRMYQFPGLGRSSRDALPSST